ncbi:unnamed protein product, partial [Closterium sp. NIES-65]
MQPMPHDNSSVCLQPMPHDNSSVCLQPMPHDNSSVCLQPMPHDNSSVCLQPMPHDNSSVCLQPMPHDNSSVCLQPMPHDNSSVCLQPMPHDNSSVCLQPMPHDNSSVCLQPMPHDNSSVCLQPMLHDNSSVCLQPMPHDNSSVCLQPSQPLLEPPRPQPRQWPYFIRAPWSFLSLPNLLAFPNLLPFPNLLSLPNLLSFPNLLSLPNLLALYRCKHFLAQTLGLITSSPPPFLPHPTTHPPSPRPFVSLRADLLALYRYKHFVAIFTDDRFGRNGISVLENILQNRWGWQHLIVARVALKRGREYDDARSSLERLRQLPIPFFPSLPSPLSTRAGSTQCTEPTSLTFESTQNEVTFEWTEKSPQSSGGAGNVRPRLRVDHHGAHLFLLHTNSTLHPNYFLPLLAPSLLFLPPAVELGMFSRGYVWITTEPTSLQSFTYDGATASFMPQVQVGDMNDMLCCPLPCVFHASSMPLPCLFRASSVPLPCLFHASSVPLPCLFRASSMPLPCLLRASSMPLPCLSTYERPLSQQNFLKSPSSKGLISMASFVPPSPALTVFRAEWKEHMSGQEGPSSPKADVYALAAYDALVLVAQAVHNNVLCGSQPSALLCIPSSPPTPPPPCLPQADVRTCIHWLAYDALLLVAKVVHNNVLCGSQPSALLCIPSSPPTPPPPCLPQADVYSLAGSIRRPAAGGLGSAQRADGSTHPLPSYEFFLCSLLLSPQADVYSLAAYDALLRVAQAADVYSLAAYDALLLVAQAVHNVLSGDATNGADSQNALVEPVPPSQGPGAYNEDGANSGSFPGVESGGVARAAGAAGAEGNGSSSDGSSGGAAAGSVLVSNSSAAVQEPGTWTHVPMPVVAPGDPASSLIPILSGAARSNFGPLLRDALLQASVMGATGRVRLTPEGDVKDGSVQLLNVRGSEFVTAGYWRLGKGFTTSDDPLAPAVQANSSTTLNLLFPGNLEKAPSGWLARQQDPLRIAVPNKKGYNQFVEILPPTAAQGNDRFTGFCLDLFRAAVARLPYELSYEFMQFGEGDATPSYTEMVYAVANNFGEGDATPPSYTEMVYAVANHFGEGDATPPSYTEMVYAVANHTYDGAIGDIAVLNFRSEAVDFTTYDGAIGDIAVLNFRSEAVDFTAPIQHRAPTLSLSHIITLLTLDSPTAPLLPLSCPPPAPLLPLSCPSPAPLLPPLRENVAAARLPHRIHFTSPLLPSPAPYSSPSPASSSPSPLPIPLPFPYSSSPLPIPLPFPYSSSPLPLFPSSPLPHFPSTPPTHRVRSSTQSAIRAEPGVL